MGSLKELTAMETEQGWVNVQVRYCPDCRVDYPLGLQNCPRCGRALVDKTVRAPAEEE